MKTQRKWILIMLLVFRAALNLAQSASAGVRFRGFVGPAWGGYAPFYYGPYGFYEPYGFYGPYSHPNAGEVKLDTKVKEAEVFINGAYAGTAGKLKTMWFQPNTYDLEIRAPGRTPYTERIYVVAGKTVHVHTDLR
jgi:PEGA domain